MGVKIGHASIDENGKARGGKAGDQNGKEVKISDYYVHSKGWVVLRCKDDTKRLKIAEAMEKACKNNDIGYDQNQRNTLWNEVKDKGFDPSKTTKKVETDCSALVRACIACAFGKDVAGNIRTATEPAKLVKTGLFEKLTDKKYCKFSDYLLRGDILCTPVSGHTVVVLNDGGKVNRSTETKKEACDVHLPILKKGDKGDTVRAAQHLLLAAGYKMKNKGKTYGADGDFGAATESAVNACRKARKLSATGTVDAQVWAMLLGVA